MSNSQPWPGPCNGAVRYPLSSIILEATLSFSLTRASDGWVLTASGSGAVTLTPDTGDWSGPLVAGKFRSSLSSCCAGSIVVHMFVPTYGSTSVNSNGGDWGAFSESGVFLADNAVDPFTLPLSTNTTTNALQLGMTSIGLTGAFGSFVFPVDLFFLPDLSGGTSNEFPDGTATSFIVDQTGAVYDPGSGLTLTGAYTSPTSSSGVPGAVISGSSSLSITFNP